MAEPLYYIDGLRGLIMGANDNAELVLREKDDHLTISAIPQYETLLTTAQAMSLGRKLIKMAERIQHRERNNGRRAPED